MAMYIPSRLHPSSMTWPSFAEGREVSCKESDGGQYPSLLPKPDVCFLVLGAGIEVRSHRVGGQECILHFKQDVIKSGYFARACVF